MTSATNKNMNSEKLQIICNILILIGGVIMALGTFGHFYYGKQLEKQKETRNENKVIVDKNSAKSNFLLDVNLILKSVKEQNDELNKFLYCLESGKKEIEFQIIYNLKVAGENFPFSRINEVESSFGNNADNYKCIDNVFTNIKLLGTLTNKFEEQANEFPSKISKEQEIYTKSIHEIFALRDFYVVEINSGKIDLSKNPFILELINTCENHVKVVDEYKIMFGKESLFVQIDKIRIKYVATNHSAVKLNQPVFSAMDAYKRMNEAKVSLIELLRQEQVILNDCASNISLNIKKLSV